MPEATSLLIEEGGRVRRIKLESLPAVVGRDESCEVVITDPAASRRHLRLESAALGCAAVDLGSSNGTTLDGDRIKRVLLKRGAELRIGDAKLTYLGGGADAEPPPQGEAATSAALKRTSPARSVPETDLGRRSDTDATLDGAPPDPGDAAAPIFSPPVSARTKAAANAVSLAIIVALNLGAFYLFKKYTTPEPRPVTYEAPTPPAPVLIDGREPAPPDPEAVARAAWLSTADEVAELVADDRFEGAFNVIKRFLSVHGSTAVAGDALVRIGELRAEKDLRLRNCLDNAETQAKLGSVTTARKIMVLAVKIAGSDPPERLATTEAFVAAAEARAASRPPTPEKK